MISLVSAISPRAVSHCPPKRATYVEKYNRSPAHREFHRGIFAPPPRGTAPRRRRRRRGANHHTATTARSPLPPQLLPSPAIAALPSVASCRGRVNVPRARRETPTANSPDGGLTRTVTSLAPKRVAVSRGRQRGHSRVLRSPSREIGSGFSGRSIDATRRPRLLPEIVRASTIDNDPFDFQLTSTIAIYGRLGVIPTSLRSGSR